MTPSFETKVHDFLAQKRLAVAGVSRHHSHHPVGNQIYRRLKNSGHEVFPVNPHMTREAWAAAGIGAAFLFAFTQTVNVNSGGTPGPSRYGLWLLPLALPWLATVPVRARAVLAIASVVYGVVVFAPKVPEAYLQPTPLAAGLWTRLPGLDNPVAEIFAERVAGAEPPPRPPLATPNCEKVLLVGVGGDALWPPRCQPTPVTDACRATDQLCYANMATGATVIASGRLPPGTP